MANENNIVYQLRKKKNLSEQTLGDIIGASQQTISRIESQKTIVTSTDLAMKLAEYFGVSIDVIVGKKNVESDSIYLKLDPREIAEEMPVDVRRFWLEMGARLAGDKYMTKIRIQMEAEEKK